MASIPRKRKNELLKNYYDGDTVGRAAVNRYLDMQRGVNPAINANELMFLRETLTEYDNEIYRGYAKLTEVLGTLGQNVWGWGEAFSHAFYKMFYYLDATTPLIKEFASNKNFFSANLEQACSVRISFLKGDMAFTWDMLKRSAILIYRHNLIIQALGITSNFDTGFLCYDPLQVEIDFSALKSSILALMQAIYSYKNQQRSKVPPKTQIAIPDEVETILENATKVQIDDLKPTKEVQDSLLAIFSQVPNTFPSVINSDFLDRVIRNDLLSNI